MPITRIHHHKLFVSDMDRSIAFYRDLLGFKLLQDAERKNLPSYDQIMGFKDVAVRVAMLEAGGDKALIALIEFKNPPKKPRDQSILYVGAQALAVVVEDAGAEYERLKAAGVKFQSPPVDIVREGKLVARANYLYDPDGIPVELYQMA